MVGERSLAEGVWQNLNNDWIWGVGSLYCSLHCGACLNVFTQVVVIVIRVCVLKCCEQRQRGCGPLPGPASLGCVLWVKDTCLPHLHGWSAESPPCACAACMISLNPSAGSERVSNFPKVAQLLRGWSWVQTQGNPILDPVPCPVTHFLTRERRNERGNSQASLPHLYLES